MTLLEHVWDSVKFSAWMVAWLFGTLVFLVAGLLAAAEWHWAFAPPIWFAGAVWFTTLISIQWYRR